jgi:hypothetical protein
MGRIRMPIGRYVEKGVFFTPQALSAMSHALEATTEILGIGGDEKQRQIVARFIIRTAKEDGSLDAVTLRDRVLAALGRTEYCGISANPQPSSIPSGIAK